MENKTPLQQHTTTPPTQPHMIKGNKGIHLTAAQWSMPGSLGAALCFSSELIHLWLLPGQYEVYLGYGIIFFLIAMAQGIIGAHLLFEQRRHLLAFGLWVNALIVVLYSFTHTIGVLVGLAFLPLSIDAWGITATIAEVGAIIVLSFLLRNTPASKRSKKQKESYEKA